LEFQDKYKENSILKNFEQLSLYVKDENLLKKI